MVDQGADMPQGIRAIVSEKEQRLAVGSVGSPKRKLLISLNEDSRASLQRI